MKRTTFAAKTRKVARQALPVADDLENEAPERQSQTQTYNFTGYGGRASRGDYRPPLRTQSDILSMQQTLGNKAVQRLLNKGAHSNSTVPSIVQRYRIIDETDYAPDATAKFISQQIEPAADGTIAYTKDTRDNTGVLTKERKGAGSYAPVPTPPSANGLPQLKYAEAGGKAMAVENTQAEPKVMYATDNVKNESNQKLDRVGADFRIEEAGGSLNVNGINLKMLAPASPQQTVNPGKFDLLDEVGEVAECNSFITYILGSQEASARVAVFKDGTDGTEHEVNVKSEKEPTKEITKHIRKKGITGGSAASLATSLADTPSGSHEQRLQPITKKRAKHYGVNEGAKPEVGEGYVITSNSPMPDGLTMTQFEQAITRLNDLTIPAKQKEHDPLTNAWGYHYAGVVAKIGDDNITLENYNRATSEGWAIDKLYQQLLVGSNDFKAFVLNIIQNQQADAVKMIEANKIPGVAKARAEWWAGIRQKWEKQWQEAGDLEKAQKQATNDAIEKIKKSEKEGLATMKSKLYHFKMYGGLAGQTFHEQWAPVTRDPVTLRIKDSADKVRLDRLPRLQGLFTKFWDVKEEGITPEEYFTATMFAGFVNQMNNVTQATEVAGIYDKAMTSRTRARAKLYKATVQYAENIAGKTPGTLLNLLTLDTTGTALRVNDAKCYDLSIDTIGQWAAKGGAILKKSKREQAEKQRKLNLIVQSLRKQKTL